MELLLLADHQFKYLFQNYATQEDGLVSSDVSKYAKQEIIKYELIMISYFAILFLLPFFYNLKNYAHIPCKMLTEQYRALLFSTQQSIPLMLQKAPRNDVEITIITLIMNNSTNLSQTMVIHSRSRSRIERIVCQRWILLGGNGGMNPFQRF